jgi:beta-galactosidase GanA
MFRKITKRTAIGISSGFIVAVVLLLLPATQASSSPNKLVDDSEYSGKEFRKCIIKDYSDMVDGDDVNWVWTDPKERLSEFKIKEGKVENKSDMHSRSMVETVKTVFKDTFADMAGKGSKGTLTADICIFEAQNFSAGKAWIPFAGGHQMQAGVGVEMVLKDGKNRVVGKFRHWAREGAQIENAAQEVAQDLMKYIGDH